VPGGSFLSVAVAIFGRGAFLGLIIPVTGQWDKKAKQVFFLKTFVVRWSGCYAARNSVTPAWPVEAKLLF
jgi:hypothetical protein